MEPKEFYMQWRESFNDYSGWYNAHSLKQEVDRIKALIAADEGEATIYVVIRGENLTSLLMDS